MLSETASGGLEGSDRKLVGIVRRDTKVCITIPSSSDYNIRSMWAFGASSESRPTAIVQRRLIHSASL